MDERVLGRIGGEVAIPEQAPGEAVAGALVVLHQPGEGGPIPADGGRHHRGLVGQRAGPRGRAARVGVRHRLPIITPLLGRSGGIGRRVGLKHRCGQGRVSSNLTSGTILGSISVAKGRTAWRERRASRATH